jgi:hypothetical protein
MLAHKKFELPRLSKYNAPVADFFKLPRLGLGAAHHLFFTRRFELLRGGRPSEVCEASRVAMDKCLAKVSPPNGWVCDQARVAILFSDLTQSYRGWRHLWGQPVNGQRTWSNAWTAYRTNLFLREHKSLLAKAYYGRDYPSNTKVGFLAEHRNLLWRAQWRHEWEYGRAYLSRTLRRNPYKFHIDLMATAVGLLGQLRRDNPKAGKKKKKVLTGCVGFDLGFTKLYARYVTNVSRRRRRRRGLR